MTEFQAALGIGQLQRFGKELDKRRALASCYLAQLKDEALLALPEYDEGHSWQSYMVVLGGSIDRNAIIHKLAKRGIQTNLGAQALNCLTYYQAKYGFGDGDCPNAARLYKQGLALPLYGKLDETCIVHICKELSSCLKSLSSSTS